MKKLKELKTIFEENYYQYENIFLPVNIIALTQKEF